MEESSNAQTSAIHLLADSNISPQQYYYILVSKKLKINK